MDNKGIPVHLNTYELAKVGPLIQDYVNDVFGNGKFMIVVYNIDRKIVWQAEKTSKSIAHTSMRRNILSYTA